MTQVAQQPWSSDGASVLIAEPPRLMSLSEITAPVAAEMEAFKRHFRGAMRTHIGLLDKVTAYILRQKGKRVRPLLVLLTAKACGEVNERSYRAAALVELLHTATLVHDDVVDEAERRRGMFSINAVWKNKIAVLFGDFLLSKGLLLALDHGDYAMLHALSDAVRRMSEGELLQIEKARLLDIDEPTYYQIISAKTASLIAACTVCGALSATDDADVTAAMRTAGEKLGLAFQIRDDLFDFGSEDVGKPLGIDIKEKKLTLPLIHALEQAPARERREILGVVGRKKKSRADIDHIGRFVRDRGGLAYAARAMRREAHEAQELLGTLPPSEAREALIGLATYTVTRKK